MPEEKKKESFTFSDKIKSTKASGANRSFANRFTSKIGSDGKPRQTLFERTKRDAPFFIAALVALLLLPFLYKYSGQVEEDTPMVSPGYEDAIVNPDRSGFDFSGDADGQISQLSGRDSMDLIVGWGKHRNEEEADTSLADFYRSGLDSSSTSDAASYKRSDMDEETNITNIYKRQRKQAPAQTRAAFRRAATKIGNLKGAGLTGRGGGRLGIGHFGGGLKAAAQKVRGPGQVNSTKPVSLQPLQAAGKPSRSYFGQGAAQEARRSKDAMSKGNAMQALMDAQMKPVEPGRIGGLASGDFGGPGGGPGGLQRNFNYNGKEPWWWDMMKQRAQMEWQLWFDLKKDWINFASKKLQTWIDGISNCLVTGNSDGDPDTFLGSGGGSGGKAPECCGMKEKRFKLIEPNIPFTSDGCKAFATKNYGQDYKKNGCPDGWQAGHGGGDQHLSGWQARKACLGALVGGELVEANSCRNMKNLYQVRTSGEVSKWNTYIYVVARNYLPEASKLRLEGSDTKRHFLCTKESDHLKIGAEVSAGVGYRQLEPEFDGKTARDGKDDKTARTRRTKDAPLVSDMARIDPENPEHGCVIYLQKGDTFNYDNFQTTMIEQLASLLRQQGVKEEDIGVEARKAFNQLDLMFIESFAAKKRLAARGWFGIASDGDAVNLPMLYWRFHDAYVRHQKTSSQRNSAVWHLNVDKRKLRKEGENYVMGDRCMFNDTVSINCDNVSDADSLPTATVTFKQGYKGAATPKFTAKDITVNATYRPLEGGEGIVQDFEGSPTAAAQTLTYTFTRPITVSVDKDGNVTGVNNNVDPAKLQGTIQWNLLRGGEVIDYAVCQVNLAADGKSVTVEEKDCPKGAQTNAACCAQAGANDNVYNYKWAGDKCVITPKTNPNPDQDPNRDPNQDPNRDPNQDPNRDPNRNPSVEATAFAPSISWVPNNPQDRKAVTAQNPLSASTFSGPLVKTYPHRADGSSCPGCQGRQFCDDLFGYKMDSKKATEFVTKVRDAYNKKYQNNANVLPIRFGADYPTDGEFMDALQIAARENLPGLERVSTAAVCELGRDFTRMSKDKHAGTRKMTSALGQKGEERYYHNELGSYLAYIHDTSVLYPDAYVTVDGQQVCDWRFQPKGLVGGGCPSAMGIEMGKGYAYNNYNGTKFNNLDQYRKSLTSTMRSAPLKDLVQGHSDLPHDCQGNTRGCRKISGKNYVSTYNSFGPNGFAGLIKDQGGSGNGTACEAFTGNSTMAVADVLRYIQGVCSAGLDYKPKGMGKAEYKPGQTPTSDGGAPGSDNSD